MPNDLPLVTVAIPAFNHERYVRKTLDSVLDGGMSQVEVVVCDDASSDATPDIIREWGRENGAKLARFKLIESPRNRGLCATLNEIVRAAQGEFIHVISSDDYFLRGGLATKTQALLDHPEWNACFCDAQAIGLDDEVHAPSLMGAGNRMNPAFLTPQMMPEELLYHWDTIPSLQSWRRGAFKAHGGGFEYDAAVFCEDFDAAWWLMSRESLGFVPEVCQAYRCRTWPQTSNRNRTREYLDMAYVLARHSGHYSSDIAGAMRTYSDALFRTATGEAVVADRLMARHFANEAHYCWRTSGGSSGEATNVRQEEPDPTQQQALMMDHLAQLREQCDDVRRKVKSLARKNEALVEKQAGQTGGMKEEITRLKNHLRYSQSSPLRALKLWWKRDQQDR